MACWIVSVSDSSFNDRRSCADTSRMTKLRIHTFLAAAISVIALSVPAGASAATTVGDPLTGTLTSFCCDYTLIRVYNNDGSVSAGAPSAGVITSIRIQAGGPAGSVDAVFLRQVGSLGSSVSFSKFAPNLTIPFPEFLPPAGQPVDTPTRIPAQAGDRVGLAVPGGVKTMMSNPAAVVPNTCGFISALDSGAVGASQSYLVDSCNKNSAAVQFTFEADVDGDGFGDESQDACPSDATRQTACLTPANITVTAVRSTAKTSSSASRTFVVANTGQRSALAVPFSIKSSKSVKNLKIVKGCKPDKTKRKCTIATIAPGASVKIKVSLKIKKSKKTTLTAKSGSVKATSTVKLKAKKK